MLNFLTDKGARGQGFKAEVLPMICETYMKARDEGVLTLDRTALPRLRVPPLAGRLKL